jgi:hypothetical protein
LPSFAGANGIAITGGPVEGRVFAVGANFLGKNAAKGFGDWKNLRGASACVNAGIGDDKLARFFEREH